MKQTVSFTLKVSEHPFSVGNGNSPRNGETYFWHKQTVSNKNVSGLRKDHLQKTSSPLWH